MMERGIGFNFSMLFYNLGAIVMLVKRPVFFLHIWLPKAHVEAPVFASMILARLLLKTGGYGFLILQITSIGSLIKFDLAICCIIVAATLAAICCSSQVDVKILIAYSSVNHMSIILCGILLANRSAALGSVVLMVGHGFISSALFYLARLSYNQRSTRSFFYALRLPKANHYIIW